MLKKTGFIIALALVAGLQARINAAEKVGATACIACHSEQGESFKKDIHSKNFSAVKKIDFEQSCETCHGAGSDHAGAAGDKTKILNPKKMSAAEGSKTCLECHDSGKRMFWSGSKHETRDVSCLNCHSVHHAKSDSLLAKETELDTCFTCHQLRKIQNMKSSHMPLREGKMKCSDCHNVHGSAGAKLLIQNSINENCYACHAEKRGPLLWEHEPVRENCLNCHEAHGAQHEKLLKVKRPRLCQQCHTEPNKGSPQAHNNSYGLGRSCLKCHSQVHGSNHPNGVRFNR